MPIEKYTESFTLSEMKCKIGTNPFGYIYPQGDVVGMDKIQSLLKRAGGKPSLCDLDDFSKGGKGKAKPEYIITFKQDIQTIIVIECKNSAKKHQSANLDRPRAFAVDGVLYYAKFLKNEYNVVAIAVSGTNEINMKVDTFYWEKSSDTYITLNKAKDIILEPVNYLELIKGKKLQKAYSIEEIRNTAIDMHNYLREIKVTEAHKPIFIAGILIALNDEDFINTYTSLMSFNLIMRNIQIAIENVLKDCDIKSNRIAYIQQVFKTLQENTKFSEIPLGHSKSITWYIEQLEMKIKPMMDYADNTADALGVFYHEFIKYSGGDGSGLGIVLTPQHLTEFMCDLANVNINSKVVDICCGSGSFLVTAMNRMYKTASPEDLEEIRKNSLYGVEFDEGLYTLAIANMIVRKDGKSNIYKGDCFNELITAELKGVSDNEFDKFFEKHFSDKDNKRTIKERFKGKNINVGLINPPYSQKDVNELEFTEHMLDILNTGGTGVVVVPMACAIGTKFDDVRERLLKHHTLKAVFSMPDEIFYPAATNVCVMVWEAHTPHDDTQETFFGFYKDDGFVKRKKLGRIDAFNRWYQIEKSWISLYRSKEVIDGLSAKKSVSYKDEWLCEAYMKVDYTKLNKAQFIQTIRDYLAFEIKHGMTDLSQKYIIMSENIDLNVESWKEFRVNELFKVERGTVSNINSLAEGDCPIVSAYGENQGVAVFANEEIKYRNSLTASMNGSKTGYVAFHGYGFNANADCGILLPYFKINVYIGLFISTIMTQFSYKYIYGRKLTKARLNSEIIKLPVTSEGEIDLEYMERFMKSLPYSDRI